MLVKYFSETLTYPHSRTNWHQNLESQFCRYLYRMEKQIFFYISINKRQQVKLRQFFFRLLHKIKVPRKELLKFRLTDGATCTFCPNSDSIEHTFLDCSEIKSFYSEASVWFNRANDTEINLYNEQINFNEIPEFHQLSKYPGRRLHLFVILFHSFENNMYVYSCKCFEKKPIQKEFQAKMLIQWQIEKCAIY